MNVDWRETGLPSQYYEAVRHARRYALNAIGLTGTTFVLLFLIGGIGGRYETFRYVRIMPYFQRSLGEIDTFLNGKALVRSLKQLDAVAIEQGVQPLSAFGFNDDLRGETLVWYAPEDGLKTIETLLNELKRSQIPDVTVHQIWACASPRRLRALLVHRVALDIECTHRCRRDEIPWAGSLCRGEPVA